MDVGLYVNVFEVGLATTLTRLMTIERGRYLDLRPLRKELLGRDITATVYADGQGVYGYGPAADRLVEYGFQSADVDLREVPRVTSNMILEGLLNRLEQVGYTRVGLKGRAEVFNFHKPISLPGGHVNVYQGFDLRSLFLRDPVAASLVFGLVVDVSYTFQDGAGNPLSPRSIASQFGSEALSQVRYIQGDLLPQRRINLEVSRQRLLEHIQPFVASHANFELPCGVQARLRQEPMRILLVAGNRGR